jgi:Flp pilus assembly protein CpaB
VSRRARAALFGCGALACAGLAAAAAGGYRSQVEAQLGELRPAVVALRPLPAGEPIEPAATDRLLEVRRVPARFVPPGALVAPEQAIGREPVATVPAGAYLLAAQLVMPGRERRRDPARQEPDGRPVEIAVSGAGALAFDGRPRGRRVDVIVTTESGPTGGAGRTYMAAEEVQLLALRERGGSSDGLTVPGPQASIATLALSRTQALRLINAESFARSIRLLAAD